jgi:hypothetical protein
LVAPEDVDRGHGSPPWGGDMLVASRGGGLPLVNRPKIEAAYRRR